MPPNAVIYHLSFIILHPVINTPVQVIDIIRILAHALACHVGNLCHIHAVTLGGLHNYVECFLISVVTDKGSYTECNKKRYERNKNKTQEVQSNGDYII